MQKIGLLYFGRLVREKGFDAILEMIEMFGQKNKELPFEIFIFGDGPYAEELKTLTTKHTEIHYFGWKDLNTIKRYVSNCHYCLMPSTFLETFGLTALTALSRGLPVLGLKKGGLIPFIQYDLDISNNTGHSTAEKLYHVVKKISNPQFKLPQIEYNLSKYSIDAWKENFTAMAGKDIRKILMVSDFKNKVGGIETYMHDAKDILEDMGYEVKIFGNNLPHGLRGKIFKYLGLFFAIFNDLQGFRLLSLLKKNKPDLIRYHSVLRNLGWTSLWASRYSSAQKWMMYHDFGYVYPFPHALTSVQQIKTPLTLRNFISSADTRNPLKILAVIFKFFSVKLIKNQLKKQIDIHLVPSQFMEDIIHKSYKISPSKIKTFSHFIQE